MDADANANANADAGGSTIALRELCSGKLKSNVIMAANINIIQMVKDIPCLFLKKYIVSRESIHSKDIPRL